jgi:hypothetical protein
MDYSSPYTPEIVLSHILAALCAKLSHFGSHIKQTSDENLIERFDSDIGDGAADFSWIRTKNKAIIRLLSGIPDRVVLSEV